MEVTQPNFSPEIKPKRPFLKIALILGGIIIVVLLIALVMQGVSMQKNVKDIVSQENTTTNTNTSTTPITDSIQIKDQEASGGAITLVAASLTQPGYIEVFRQQDQDMIGPLVAVSRLLQAGITENIVINTIGEASFKPGETLIAHITFDNGKGTYDPSVSSIGKPGVYQKFNIK